jgi:uncharacterized membrane protein YeaQ/YmgE (transglycosylase-associated protein family)
MNIASSGESFAPNHFPVRIYLYETSDTGRRRSPNLAVQFKSGIVTDATELLLMKIIAIFNGSAFALPLVKAVGIERGGGPPEKQGGEAIMFEWIIVGLVSGWLAGKIINGVGYGMFCDILLGLVGGVVGGIIFEILGVRAHNFVGAVLMSTAGATALVVATRILRDEI